MALEFLYNLDAAILMFINKGLANPLFDFLKYTQDFTYIFWGLLILFFLFKGKKELAVIMIIAALMSTLTTEVLKVAIARQRPYQVLDVRQLVQEENNTSFPSNHVQLSVVLSTIVFAYYRRLGIALFAISAVIAFSRIYLGVHWLSDVLGGVIIGILLANLILFIKNKFYKSRKKKK